MALRMPHAYVVANQGFSYFGGKSDTTFMRTAASFAAVRRRTRSGRGGDQLAHIFLMKLDFIVCLGVLLAILFVGVVGAFLLYVPALTVFSVVTVLLGLGLMFALGMLTGRRARKMSPFTHRAMPIR
jgi:hypothetical protein